ncbi:helix-turn-helix transcriptional regulator [Flavobacterium sp. JP2137]|uniref:helix-turn-helix transcriptional regulator n=1 Tax=Flavobacterium sp. JP2137 TaxID=3414510 RepID=UPI003D2FC9D7
MMESDRNFTIRKPYYSFLSGIVEYYFYIDVPVSQLSEQAEFIIPFPRITFGYFFDHPFTVINDTLKTSELVNIAISRISLKKITVQPSTDRIKILGAHLKPFGLAYFTKKPINSLPWLINTEELFGSIAKNFLQKVKTSRDIDQMFNEVEDVFLDNILIRDLSLITKAIELIEVSSGHIEVTELSKQLGVSDRTVRNHFYDYIGCSPKEYFRIVKLKQVAFQMKHSENSLTHIAYDNNYFDQAHFIHEVKGITGQTPNQLRKEIPNFHFLQF